MNTKKFTHKEKNEVDKKISKLKKVVNKKDELSAQESIEILSDLAETNQLVIAKKISELSNKHNKFMDNLSSRIMRLDNDMFTADVIQEIIDYCFRFGNKEIQRNGVLLLDKYQHIDRLKNRYQFVFLKDKTAANLLVEKVYLTNKETIEK